MFGHVQVSLSAQCMYEPLDHIPWVAVLTNVCHVCVQPGRNLPQGITAARTPQEKIRGCYINKGGPELQEVLRHTRPGEG